MIESEPDPEPGLFVHLERVTGRNRGFPAQCHRFQDADRRSLCRRSGCPGDDGYHDAEELPGVTEQRGLPLRTGTRGVIATVLASIRVRPHVSAKSWLEMVTRFDSRCYRGFGLANILNGVQKVTHCGSSRVEGQWQSRSIASRIWSSTSVQWSAITPAVVSVLPRSPSWRRP